MGENILLQKQRIHRPLEEVFAFFSDARNLETLTPPWLNFRIMESPEKIEAGSLIRYKLRVRGIPIRWTTEILEWNPPFGFVDTQLEGPYALWHHTHRFSRTQNNETLMEDIVRYRLPLEPLSAPVHWLVVRRDVEKIFDFRRQTIDRMFAPAGAVGGGGNEPVGTVRGR